MGQIRYEHRSRNSLARLEKWKLELILFLAWKKTETLIYLSQYFRALSDNDSRVKTKKLLEQRDPTQSFRISLRFSVPQAHFFFKPL